MASERDTLFLALTRPALKWGVPFEALALNGFCVFVMGALLQAPTWWRSPIMFWLMSVPIHLALRQLTAWHYHWCRLLRLSVETATWWTLQPIPTRLPKRAKDLASSV